MTRMLLVDDNRMNQIVGLGMLDKIGFSAEVAGDGDAAIAMISKRPYDLIFMDCEMPGMDGYDTTRVIRELEHTASRAETPIIGVSARTMAGDRDVAIEAGMDDYLTKPVRIEDLQRAVERWLGATEADADSVATAFAVRTA